MNGAENLLETLVAAGVEVCFANPGTSEMHLVSAIGKSERMRPVLCLFEGVASGAADGYARMLDKPALLAEIASQDADGDIRLEALQAIDRLPTLERLAREARGRDKAEHQKR